MQEVKAAVVCVPGVTALQYYDIYLPSGCVCVCVNLTDRLLHCLTKPCWSDETFALSPEALFSVSSSQSVFSVYFKASVCSRLQRFSISTRTARHCFNTTKVAEPFNWVCCHGNFC